MPFERALTLANSQSKSLRTLAKLAGADAATFYTDANLTGADLRNQDLRGMSFERADLTGVKVNSRTKCDHDLAERLFDDLRNRIAHGMLMENVERANALFALAELSLARQDYAQAERFLEEYLSVAGDVDADIFPLAAAGLPSSPYLVLRWLQGPFEGRNSGRTMKRILRTVPLEPLETQVVRWFEAHAHSLDGEELLVGITRLPILARLDMVVGWLVRHPSDPRSAPVAAWIIALGGDIVGFEGDSAIGESGRVGLELVSDIAAGAEAEFRFSDDSTIGGGALGGGALGGSGYARRTLSSANPSAFDDAVKDWLVLRPHPALMGAVRHAMIQRSLLSENPVRRPANLRYFNLSRGRLRGWYFPVAAINRRIGSNWWANEFGAKYPR